MAKDNCQKIKLLKLMEILRQETVDIIHRRRCKLGRNRHAAGIGSSGVPVLPLDIHIGRQAHYFCLLLPLFCSVWLRLGNRLSCLSGQSFLYKSGA